MSGLFALETPDGQLYVCRTARDLVDLSVDAARVFPSSALRLHIYAENEVTK